MELLRLKENECGVPLKEGNRFVCKKPVSAKRDNPTKFFAHLQEHHPVIYSKIAPSSKSSDEQVRKHPTLKEIIDKGKKYDSKPTRACKLNKTIAYYLAKDMHPIYIVERPEFKRVVAKLDPKYVLPSQNYFSET